MPVTGNSEKLTRMSKLLDKLLKACVTVVKFLQGTILLSNELTWIQTKEHFRIQTLAHWLSYFV